MATELLEALIADLQSKAGRQYTVRVHETHNVDVINDYYNCSIDRKCDGYAAQVVCQIRMDKSKILVRFNGRESLLGRSLMMTAGVQDEAALEAIYLEMESRGMISHA